MPRLQMAAQRLRINLHLRPCQVGVGQPIAVTTMLPRARLNFRVDRPISRQHRLHMAVVDVAISVRDRLTRRIEQRHLRREGARAWQPSGAKSRDVVANRPGEIYSAKSVLGSAP
jgi:hypothetical protein